MSRKWVWLLLVLAVAVPLRVWRLDKAPVELFGDEIDLGLQANSLWQTGRDYSGHPLPISLQSFDESRLPLAVYLTVPFVAAFGLNEYSVRLPFVVLGLTLIPLILVLTNKLFGNLKIGLTAAALLAISPWHIHFSRWANDNLGILILILPATAFFIKGLKKPFYLSVSALLFSLGFYAYSVSTIFIPLFVLLLLTLYRDRILHVNFKFLALAATVGLAVSLPYLYTVSQQVGVNRFSQISAFTDSTLLHDLLTRRSLFTSPVTPLFRNKPLFMLQEITNSYLRSFSTEFLFFNGDPILRHSVGGMGMLYFFEIITLSLGLAWVARHWHLTSSRLLLGWLLIAPLASALTKNGGNHAGRLIVMLPPLVLLSSLGLSAINRKILVFPLALLALFNFSWFMYRYHVEWPADSWRFWQFGYKEAVTVVRSQDTGTNRIFFNNTYETALPRFLFWSDYSPALFQTQYPQAIYSDDLLPGFRGFRLGDRYYFGTVTNLVKDQGFRELLRPGDIYLASYRDEIGTSDWTVNPTLDIKVYKIIRNPAGEPVMAVLGKEL